MDRQYAPKPPAVANLRLRFSIDYEYHLAHYNVKGNFKKNIKNRENTYLPLLEAEQVETCLFVGLASGV